MTPPLWDIYPIYPKECKLTYKRHVCATMFIAVLFTIAKLWNQSRYSTIEKI
jgi:hypothetical protein